MGIFLPTREMEIPPYAGLPNWQNELGVTRNEIIQAFVGFGIGRGPRDRMEQVIDLGGNGGVPKATLQ